MSDTLDRLQNIVGGKNVIENPDFYSNACCGSLKQGGLRPSFMVKPANSDQVKELVKWANDTGTPVIPVSSGAPHRTGGTKPEVPGALIIDLSGMKKILRIDKRHRLALIEPGVTWYELSAELAQQGLRITPPLLPKKGKSVIASLLDREPLVSPKYQWNMTEPLRSMEIIFGTGDRIYSGMGGHRGDTDEAWENGTIPLTNAGPHQIDFIKMVTASQGTFGIVTWASVKLELAGKVEKPLFAEGQSIDELTDFLYKVLKFRLGDEVCIFNKKALSSILASEGKEMGSYEEKLSQWTALVNLKWGALKAKEKIAVQEADLNEIAQESGVVTSMSVAGLSGEVITEHILSLSGDNNWKEKAEDDYMEIFFLSTLDKISSQLKKAAEVADKYGYSFGDCPVYLQPLHQGVAVNCHIILPVSDEQAESGDLDSLYPDMCNELFKAGAFYSRPYGKCADLVYNRNTQYTVVTNKLKDIFDPEHILNPGKLCF